MRDGDALMYRKVEARLWRDEKFLALTTSDARLLWLRLLTGPELTPLPGLVCVSRVALADALEWSLERFDAAAAQLERERLLRADWRARVVIVPNAIRHNPPSNPNVVKGWRVFLDDVPTCALRDEWVRACADHLRAFGATGTAHAFAAITSGWRNGSANGSANGMRNRIRKRKRNRNRNYADKHTACDEQNVIPPPAGSAGRARDDEPTSAVSGSPAAPPAPVDERPAPNAIASNQVSLFACQSGSANRIETAAPRRARSTTRTRRVPDAFVLTPALRTFALVHGLDATVIDDEWARFRDHEFAQPKSDWAACWRTWVRNAVTYRARAVAVPRGGGGGATAAEKTMTNVQRMLAKRGVTP